MVLASLHLYLLATRYYCIQKNLHPYTHQLSARGREALQLRAPPCERKTTIVYSTNWYILRYLSSYPQMTTKHAHPEAAGPNHSSSTPGKGPHGRGGQVERRERWAGPSLSPPPPPSCMHIREIERDTVFFSCPPIKCVKRGDLLNDTLGNRGGDEGRPILK